MFSVKQKREISEKVQRALRETMHPELPNSDVQFSLHVQGRESWSWANIKNNAQVEEPSVNPWNEAQAAPLSQRMWDLLRHQRSELHTAGLISDREYAELAQDHAAVRRLEDYDGLADRTRVALLKAVSEIPYGNYKELGPFVYRERVLKVIEDVVQRRP